MGTFLISPLRGQKGTDLLQVCPLLLGNEECPHFFPEARATLREQRESAVGRRSANLKPVPAGPKTAPHASATATRGSVPVC